MAQSTLLQIRSTLLSIWQQIGNNSNSTDGAVDFVADTVDFVADMVNFVASVYCVRGQSNMVDFQQSGPC